MNTQQTNRVSQLAFNLWDAAGRPHGKDLEHWLQAEREVLAKKPPAKKAATTRKPRKAAAKSPLAGSTKTATAKKTTHAKKKK